MRQAALALGAAVVVLSGCALKGDVRRVERQLVAMQEEAARVDSARAVELARLADLLDAVGDSLDVHQRSLIVFRGELRSDLTDIQRQLVMIQELTGQSQQRLSELRTQLEQRPSVPLGVAVPGGAAPADAAAPEGLPGANQLFELGLQQLRRGSPQAARMAFQQLVTSYPDHERVPDALYFIGESWGSGSPDSAAAAYELVARNHATSLRAPGALYKLGLIAERRGDRDAARVYYQRVLADYPRSEEAALAREKLNPSP
ncbi:MAG: tetratricopeptide repeat protein [Gemmatimonadota bacterium]|nr:tetratricopeptide repeat protein [Gemmatimonadota bacterium]